MKDQTLRWLMPPHKNVWNSVKKNVCNKSRLKSLKNVVLTLTDRDSDLVLKTYNPVSLWDILLHMYQPEVLLFIFQQLCQIVLLDTGVPHQHVYDYRMLHSRGNSKQHYNNFLINITALFLTEITFKTLLQGYMSMAYSWVPNESVGQIKRSIA